MKKIIILIILCLFLTACAGYKEAGDKNMQGISPDELNKNINMKIRPAAVAGQFYPADPAILKNKIEGYLEDVKTNRDEPDPNPLLAKERGQLEEGAVKAIMAPHAGYDFSGAVAAYSYQAVADKKVKTVVIIGNSHTAYFSGLAVDANDFWETPLGKVAVDKESADKLIKNNSDIKYDSGPHANEHSLEVQLPFLQTVLPSGFKIVPLLFGNSGADTYKKLAKTLADNLGEEDLIVVSTDMSHYPPYKDANKIDQLTLDIIKTLDIAKLEKHIEDTENAGVVNEQTLICGADGVKTIMELAKIKGWTGEILNYQNSGDALIGTKDQVVGYGAAAFVDSLNSQLTTHNPKELQSDQLTKEQKNILMSIATTTVENYVKKGDILDFDIKDARLNIKQGAFVTLRKDGQLRGCIGQIMPGADPLWQVVRDMAIAAAAEDPRFDPVTANELPALAYEISVLSVPKKINDWHDIEMGRHGVIVRKGFRSGVFLPQVATETGWNLEEFLSELCSQKAGLPADCYKNDPEAELQVFEALVF